MDLQIVISSFISFLVFLILHVVVFSRIDHRHVLVWIVRTCMLGAVFPFLLAYIISLFFPIPGIMPFSQFFLVSSFSFILYSLLSIGYILGVFGLMESSLRIKILEQISRAGKRGIHKKELYKVYNRDVIIGKRLKRFIKAGDVIYNNGMYTIRKRFSYFIVHAFIFESIKKIYLNKR